MHSYSYRPRGVCASQIRFDLEDGKLHNINFMGGCHGNLKAIGLLLEGADAQEAADKLRGNTCGNRPTSCADQLSRAIDKAFAVEA